MDKYHLLVKKLKALKIVFVAIIFVPIVYLIGPLVTNSIEKASIVKIAPTVESKSKASQPKTNLKYGAIDPENGLIVDDNYKLVEQNCGACHSLKLVTQNSATREGWKEIIVWMQTTQKLWDLGKNEVLILDYLGKNYKPNKKGRRQNLKNIDWYEL